MSQTSIGTMDEWDAAYPGHRFRCAMHESVVAAARTARARASDGPAADHRDEEGPRGSCLLARPLDFDGKWRTHPAQVAAVNGAFSPTDGGVEWEEKVTAAHEAADASGSGALSVHGRIVDAASIRIARNTLDVARR